MAFIFQNRDFLEKQRANLELHEGGWAILMQPAVFAGFLQIDPSLKSGPICTFRKSKKCKFLP